MSKAKEGREGLDGSKSSLFHYYHFAKLVVKPRYFILENVGSMKNSDKELISRFLGVLPVRINSKVFTGQNRDRYYWTNIPVELPDWSGPSFSSVIGVDPSARAMVEKRSEEAKKERREFRKRHGRDYSNFRSKIFVKRDDELANCITANKSANMKISINDEIRYLTPLECERLQGVKDNYTAAVSETQRYKMLGNGFTVPVIAHILKGIKLKRKTKIL